MSSDTVPLITSSQMPVNAFVTARSARKLRILVVEDSAIYRRLLERILSPQQYDLRISVCKNDGLQQYAEFRPDIIITDWMMPDGSGLELCEAVRSSPNAGYCYVILLTAQDDKEHVVQGLAAGADDYLTKPFHEGELLARLSVGRRTVDLHLALQEKNRLLAELALTDALTGLPNRRAIEQVAVRELSAAARHHYPVWLAMADLDRFKAINDTYGHEVGDQVLQSFAQLLKENTRKSNICGRLGGEEFVIILTHVDRDGTFTALDRLRRQFADREFTTAQGSFRASVSVGLTQAFVDGSQELSEILAAADKALYVAKANGRNRIEYASAP